MNEIIVYTDGSCLGNPGKGGHACVFWDIEKILEDGMSMIKSEKILKIIKGGEKLTTNNRMELQAIINACDYILSGEFQSFIQNKKVENEPIEIKLFTDSMYVKNGLTEWIHGWIAKKWKDIKNEDLWKKLILQKTEIEEKGIILSIFWVKAHAIDEKNKKVDRLARDEAERIR